MLAQSNRCTPAPFGLQLLPTRACEKALVALVGKFGVGDRDLAAQSGKLPQLLLLARRSSDLRSRSSMSLSTATSMRLTKKLATLAILLGIAALRDEMLKPGQIGLDHLFIDPLREQQRDVDVDALADELANRRQARALSPAP